MEQISRTKKKREDGRKKGEEEGEREKERIWVDPGSKEDFYQVEKNCKNSFIF